MSSKMSTDPSTAPRRHSSRPAHPSSPESALSSGSWSDTSSDALSESSKGPPRDSSEESSDGTSRGPSDRSSGDFSRRKGPLFALEHQGPVFFFGTAKKSASSDRLSRGRKSQKKVVSHGEEDHNARPEKNQIPPSGRICNSRVHVAPILSHRNRSFQPPLFTFAHASSKNPPICWYWCCEITESGPAHTIMAAANKIRES